MLHTAPSDFAGRTVRLHGWLHHPQYDLGGQTIEIEDWWDRVAGKSWMWAKGNPACLVYAMRTGFSEHPIPTDDEVLYGHFQGLGVLVHMSEVVGSEEPQP